LQKALIPSENRRNILCVMLRRLWQEERGTDLVEYALITAAVALGLVVTLGELRQSIAGMLGSVVGGVQGISRCIEDQKTDYCREQEEARR